MRDETAGAWFLIMLFWRNHIGMAKKLSVRMDNEGVRAMHAIDLSLILTARITVMYRQNVLAFLTHWNDSLFNCTVQYSTVC